MCRSVPRERQETWSPRWAGRVLRPLAEGGEQAALPPTATWEKKSQATQTDGRTLDGCLGRLQAPGSQAGERGPPSRVSPPTPCRVSSDEALFQNAATDATVRGSHPRFRRQSRVLHAASSAFVPVASPATLTRMWGQWPGVADTAGPAATLRKAAQHVAQAPLVILYPSANLGARSQVTARAYRSRLGGPL